MIIGYCTATDTDTDTEVNLLVQLALQYAKIEKEQKTFYNRFSSENGLCLVKLYVSWHFLWYNYL